MTVTERLQQLATAAAEAWTPEQSITVAVTPNGITIDGRILNRDEKREYRVSRLCSYGTLEHMAENWLLQLLDQVKQELARHAGTRTVRGDMA